MNIETRTENEVLRIEAKNSNYSVLGPQSLM